MVCVALGSNLGDSPSILQSAFDRLQTLSAGQFLRSSLWETAPVDCPPGSPPFVNAAAAFLPLPGETPDSILGKLQQLERDFGRRPKAVHNETRPLDLDLICFGPETRHSRELTLPHPRAHERRFVLAPLVEIMPDLILPRHERTISEILGTLPPTGERKLVVAPLKAGP